jgi:hypothetical protein
MRVVYHLCIISITAISTLAQSYTCLNDIKSDDVVSVRLITTKTGQQITKKTIVAQTLKNLKARCVHGKLLDRGGRQIRFYRLQGCWGNPPANYQEILERQRKDLADLKKKYTVVEMTCNPNGIAIP